MLRVLVILAAAGAAVLLYAIAIERNWFALRRHRVPCLPPGSRPLRILHISDLHLRNAQRRKHRFLARLARLEPDLIVGTGDFLGDPHAVAATVRTLNTLRGNAPAIFVCGSNDYYSPVPKNPLRYFRKGTPRHVLHGEANPWPEMIAGLEAGGWRFLNNATAAVDGTDVVGLDDAHIGRADLSVIRPRAHDGFRLAVAHSPDVAETLAEAGYDLIVCGHTHGGQLRVPGFGAIVTNSNLPRAMARGLHPLGRAWLHVSAGLGTSMFAPYRIACRPEVCLLEAVPRPE